MTRLPAPRCPDCGGELVSEPGIAGLCPRCLLSLALVVSPPGGPDSEGVTISGLAPGHLLGERYQIRELLGRGGQGEVYRAFDLKLRLDVALKSVRPGRAGDERAREQLRREVRAAREVMSPNVCRIFDLVDEDGQELLSMEYIDGRTLGETLSERGPLALQEAREIASQFLSGLEAIHRAGLVHRDFKPENVMLTRAGRVVVMDLGVAKAERDGGGTISGTPGYMPPEQARGDAVDPRADVYAAGVVLAEMVSVGGASARQARQELWRAVRETPLRVPEGPWADVLKKTLDPDPRGRHASARALARALEEVTQRLPGLEEKRPYPGLSSFTEKDAEYFFGREVETESVWKKLKRPRLLGLIGPSGAGKSSFLQAGLLPTLPSTWRAVRATPGTRPFAALAQALVPQFPGDMEALQELVRFEEPEAAVSVVSRLRKRHEHVLVIVDQFEELFTQNPKETQEAFAALLGRLVLEADAHVVVALRDDFLIHCHGHEALTPILNELTLLGPLTESGLGRALVQPALACGYRFEDEALVEEMLSEVKGERGALPLLAFAASRLWDLRNRERGLLTRAAYQEIGGVAGALAQHAEATLERIGASRTPLVRELFRNLVTAQGTRAVRERDELLSVFGDESRGDADDVLRALVDARLLTEYERAGEGGESHAQVEIVHESLLSAWPRLVRWQTQDADGAQLRDQLRQAARLWEDRGRAEDVLWTGAAYRDLALWRERYPGGLTATEDAFSQAAARVNGRRRRRRRILGAAVVTAAAAVALTTSILWRNAKAESFQKEAAQLLALGRLRLEDHPSAMLAYVIASLERADSAAARKAAVEALWRGPTEFLFGTEGASVDVRFSPDGRFLAYGSHQSARLYERDGGASRVVAPGQSLPPLVDFSGDSGLLLVRPQEGGPIRLFPLPQAAEKESLPVGDRGNWFLRDDRVLTFTLQGKQEEQGLGKRAAVSWPLSGEAPQSLGVWDGTGASDFDVTSDGSWLAEARRGRLVLRSLDRLDQRASKPTGVNEKTVWASRVRPALATIDGEGRTLRLWSTADGEPVLDRTLPSLATETIDRPVLDRHGRFVAATFKGDRLFHRLWDLKAPPDTEPLALRDRDSEHWIMGSDFDPGGRWLATLHDKYGSLWALHEKRPRVFRGIKPPYYTAVSFSPDGRHLVSGSYGGEVWLWPLDSSGGSRRRLHYEENHWLGAYWPAFDPEGRFVIVGDVKEGRLLQIPLDGTATSVWNVGNWAFKSAVRSDGLLLATASRGGVSLRDMQSGEERWLPAGPATEDCQPNPEWAGILNDLRFLPDGRLLTIGSTGLRVFDLSSGESTRLRPCNPVVSVSVDSPWLALTPDARTALIAQVTFDTARTSELLAFDLERRAEKPIASHGSHVTFATLDPSGRLLVTGSGDGLVRVGPFGSDEEPHLLYGHSALVTSLAVSPDGKWIASAAEDGTIRLWPMPEGTPLHTLPYDELLSKLRSLTNLRVVPEPDSATGYKVGPGPFPGWAMFPEW